MAHARMKRMTGMSRPWTQAIRAFALMAGLVLAGLAAQPARAQDLSWVKQAGSALPNIGNAIAADGSGNTCVAGVFQGSVTFGPHPTNPTGLTLTSAGVSDIFVAKYAAAGALLWVQQIGGAAGDIVYGIALDGNGNCYITGVSEGSDGLSDIFAAKVDAGGALLWTKQTGGESESVGYAIAADGDGNSYVTGAFGGSAIFGPGETHETTLDSADSAGIFVAKYDADGALIWAVQTGSSSGSIDVGAGIAVDGDGNSYVTGAFEGAATFGPDETNQTILTSAGVTDIFVAKYGAATPLAVTLGYAYAELRNEEVFFQWQTATESGTVGFNILAEGPNGFAPLNQTLIPAKAVDSVTPVDYAFAAATDAKRYTIQEVSLQGGVKDFGPFDVVVAYGSYIEPPEFGASPTIWLPVVVR